MTVRDEHINARCRSDQKDAYIRVAERFGYGNLSEFLLTVMDSLVEDYGTDRYACHMLHVCDDRIVAVDTEGLDMVATPSAAYKVVAPERFWEHLRAAINDAHSSTP